jgi:multiple sugar transport system substrate-binding protein
VIPKVISWQLFEAAVIAKTVKLSFFKEEKAMQKRILDRRDFLRLSAAATAGALLSACGPAATQEAPKEEAASSEQEASSGQGFQGTVEFWDWDHPPRIAFTEQLVKEWQEANSGVTLKYNPLPWTDIETKLLTAASAGSGPAFSNIHFFWRYDLQRAKVLAPYPDDMFDWDKLVSTPFNRDPETGKIYTCDFCFYCDQVYFNQELLEAEGIKPEDIPTNWDDFIAMAQQLTKTDANGKITQVGCSLTDYWAREWLWHTLVYQQGGWLYNETGDQALWDKEEGVRALQFIKDFYHTFKIDDAEFLEQGAAFGNAKAAMYINQGYSAAGIAENFPQMGGKWSTAPTPTFTGKPEPSSGMALPEEGFGVFSTFPPEVQEVAFSYIKHMIGSDERRLEWADLMDGPPDRLDLLDHPDLKQNDTGRAIETQAMTMPWRVIYGERPLEAEKFWRTMYDEVTLGNEEPQVALAKATEQMNAALKASGKRSLIVERNYKAPTS